MSERAGQAGFRICPECHEEYTLAATECAECGLALVDPGALPAEDAADAFPGVEDLVCVRVGPLPWTRALSEGLGQAGIAHRVEADARGEEAGGVDPRRFGGESVFGTWVLPEDEGAARELDAALFAHLEPESAGAAVGDETCPACEEPLAPDATECAGCGLSFG